ncbi:MAG: helicase-related protein [Myxococcota bacterium]
MPPEATRSVALLGPTNTGKTHKAVERMLEHPSGMIGLPLRLLAREIYDRVSARLGEDRVALVTGEEKRVPARADYWICTTEAMPLTREVDFVAVDEVQLATHDERGHVFTDRMLHARGRRETWFMGAGTIAGVVERLVPAAQRIQHPRLSKLSYAGASKLSRLPPRSAVVAFSLKELYEIAGRLRSLRGGVALVLGALSPRTRNAQVALFQSGDVDYLVATDAVGMGLNLDVGHVAFASLRKFDGQRARTLEASEVGQIAGRAGRFLRDGSFGSVLPLELPRDLALRVEAHRFDPITRVRYRNSELDFSAPAALLDSLRAPPPLACLTSISAGDDLRALEVLLRDASILRELGEPARLELLWQVCQIPDFRRILFEVHVDLLRLIWEELKAGPLGIDFVLGRARELDRLDGDPDALMARIASLRTWAFVANQANWVRRGDELTLELAGIEDRLSDALHQALVARFVEKRARPRVAAPRVAGARRELVVDSPRDDAFRPFMALESLKLRLAPDAAPAPSGATRADTLFDAPHETFELDAHGFISAAGVRLARLVRGSALALPEVRLVEADDLTGASKLRLQRRLLAFARDSVTRLLGPVRELARSELAPVRAVAHALERGLGTALVRELLASLLVLDEAGAAELAHAGVVVGTLSVHTPASNTGSNRSLRALLVSTFQPEFALPRDLSRPSHESSGLPSVTWLALGYVALGPRVLRVDLAERVARSLAAAGDVRRELASFGVPRARMARTSAALEALVSASSASAGVQRSAQ